MCLQIGNTYTSINKWKCRLQRQLLAQTRVQGEYEAKCISINEKSNGLWQDENWKKYTFIHCEISKFAGDNTV